jgi:hypothetical protein
LAATFFEYDALLVASRITTNYLCLMLDDDTRKWRTRDRPLETEQTLRRPPSVHGPWQCGSSLFAGIPTRNGRDSPLTKRPRP